jgi:guanylate kinase
MVDADEFVEYATVHGHRYGTTRDAVRSASDAGQNLILDVDVQGALQIRERVPEAVLVFVFPPTADMLAERLRGRATESDELVMRRLKNAQGELEKAEVFDYIVVNDQVGRAVDEVRAILIAESRRTAQAIDLSTVIRQLQRRIDEILAGDFDLSGE